MFNGAFALLERSLRIDARSWSPHLARLGLMGTIYVSLCFALLRSFMLGAPGLHFFQGIAYLDATFMTLLGVGFFSTSITEEKEEDTLGLMLMAGISPLGILVGKSGGRLWQSLLLVAIQYPFILLAVTMGGVMGVQVWAVTVALLAYMVFLAGFGLLCSTLAPRNQIAASWMVVGLAIYIFVPIVADQFWTDHATWLVAQGGKRRVSSVWWLLVEGISHISVFQEMGTILTTGFGQTAFSLQVISNAISGTLCAGLSWLLFGIATRDPSTEATTRGLVVQQQLSPFSTGTRMFRSSSFRLQPSTWKNPFIWKDFYFVSGGSGMMLVRVAYFTTLGLIALGIEAKSPPPAGWFYLVGFVIWLSVAVDAGRVLSRSLQDEVRGQTLAALMMLPRSPVGIVYAKFAGAMIGWLPGPIVSLIVILFSPAMQTLIADFFKPHQGNGLLLLMLVLLFALIPHFAALASLYVRWGAVALAIGMTIGIVFAIEMGSEFIRWAVGPSVGQFSQNAEFAGHSLMMFCLCIACHIGVLLRFQALASK